MWRSTPYLRAPLTTVVVAALALRWLEWLVPSTGLDFVAGVASLASSAILAAVVLERVSQAGRVTHDRILGAVAVYLLSAWSGPRPTGTSRVSPPATFRSIAESDSPYAFFYYSVVTQLYPANLLARLVSDRGARGAVELTPPGLGAKFRRLSGTRSRSRSAVG